MKNKEKHMTEIIDAYLDGKTIAVKADGNHVYVKKRVAKNVYFTMKPVRIVGIGYVHGRTRNISRDL